MALSSVQSTPLGSNPMSRADVTQTRTGPEKAHVSRELYEQEYRYVWTLSASQASLYWEGVLRFWILEIGTPQAQIKEILLKYGSNNLTAQCKPWWEEKKISFKIKTEVKPILPIHTHMVTPTPRHVYTGSLFNTQATRHLYIGGLFRILLWWHRIKDVSCWVLLTSVAFLLGWQPSLALGYALSLSIPAQPASVIRTCSLNLVFSTECPEKLSARLRVTCLARCRHHMLFI